jgi:hypothetical protein
VAHQTDLNRLLISVLLVNAKGVDLHEHLFCFLSQSTQSTPKTESNENSRTTNNKRSGIDTVTRAYDMATYGGGRARESW